MGPVAGLNFWRRGEYLALSRYGMSGENTSIVHTPSWSLKTRPFLPTIASGHLSIRQILTGFDPLHQYVSNSCAVHSTADEAIFSNARHVYNHIFVKHAFIPDVSVLGKRQFDLFYGAGSL
jgi:hypothetical protein